MTELKSYFDEKFSQLHAKMAEMHKEIESNKALTTQLSHDLVVARKQNAVLEDTVDYLREEIRTIKWEQRRTQLIVFKAKKALDVTSPKEAVRKLLSKVNLEGKVECSNVYWTRPIGAYAEESPALCFTVASIDQVQHFYTRPALTTCGELGISVRQQMYKNERERRKQLWTSPAFRAAVEEEKKKAVGVRLIAWQLDTCLLGRGHEQQVWTLESARKADARTAMEN